MPLAPTPPLAGLGLAVWRRNDQRNDTNRQGDSQLQSGDLITTSNELRCVECGTVAEGTAEGWKAYIGGGFDGESREVGSFCPACAEREFGPDAE